MPPSESTRKDRAHLQLYALSILIVVGVCLRFWLRTPIDFWEDEIISATHAVQPFWQLLVNTIRNDVHPPLYFVQLHFWALLSPSDLWLKLNSVLWSLAALASLWWTVERLNGGRVALLATAIFAILPSPVYMADQLRMYAMLATLFIWAFYFASIVFRGANQDWKSSLSLLALLVAICFTHAIGTIAVFSNGIYALGLILRLPKDERRFGVWMVIYGATALLAMPWIVTGAIHDANLLGMGFVGLLSSVSSTMIGQLAFHNHVLRVVGATIAFSIIGLGLTSSKNRLLTISFLIVPVLLFTGAELLYKPIFKWNFFSTLEAPFLALVLADGLVRSEHRLVPPMSILGVVILLSLSIYTRGTFSESQGFRALANLIRSNYRAGDVVYVPQPSFFGGLAWYLEGPRWGSPLAIAQRPSPQWRKVYDMLGPRLTKLLWLEPKSQTLRGSHVTMVVGNDSDDQIDGSRIWLITAPRADLRPGYPPTELNGLKPVWSKHENLYTTLYASSRQRIEENHENPVN